MQLGARGKGALGVLAAILILALVLSVRDNEGSGAKAEPERSSAQTQAAPSAPNVVFIYTDDQDERTFTRDYMPKTFRLLVDKGTRFEDAMTATPICCPSRIGYLTGQYPHNNGVFANNPGFAGLRASENNLAMWMRRAGYATGWIGKFLQGYDEDKALTEPAPGFSEWAISSPSTYFGYELFEEDQTREPPGYLTDVLTRETTRIIGEQNQSPFFLTVNYLAPHKDKNGQEGPCEVSAEPAPIDLGSRGNLALPKPPSFNEDVRDKRAYVSKQRLEGRRLERLKVKHRCRVESLGAVDRGVARIHEAVKDAGEIDDTIFVLTTDNGLLLGQHRLEGKGVPYEEGLQVPFVMKVPDRVLGRSAVKSSNALVANIDIAPTLLELTGVEPCISATRCRRLDGHSLVPLLEGREEGLGPDRAILIEGGANGSNCDYRGVRTTDAVLFRRVKREGTGCVPSSPPELYDLAEDPFQLDNLGVTDPDGSRDLRNELLERLGDLERCSGIQGRDPNERGPFCG